MKDDGLTRCARRESTNAVNEAVRAEVCSERIG